LFCTYFLLSFIVTILLSPADPEVILECWVMWSGDVMCCGPCVSWLWYVGRGNCW